MAETDPTADTSLEAPATVPEAPLQPHNTDPPTEPVPGNDGPTDALEPSPWLRPMPEPAQVPVRPEVESPTAGPEDAMDPTVENAGDYRNRVGDAAHYTHQPLPDDEVTFDGPRTVPVAQNEQAEHELAAAPVPSATGADVADGDEPAGI